MIATELSPEFRGFQAAMRTFGKDARFAAMVAATRTASAIRARLTGEMPSIFDRPTPFTRRSLFVRPATKANLQAHVGFKDFAGKGTPAARYLMPQVTGGARHAKRFERALQAAGILPRGWFAMPADNADLDAFGNMKRGQIVKLLSSLRAFGEQGYLANRSRTRASRGTRRGEQYFAARPGNPGLPPGVYKRGGTKKRDALPVLMFVRGAHYQKRFPFERIAEEVAAERLAPEFYAALDQAITASWRRAA